MKRKVEEWKRKGYNTMLLEYKLKGLKAVFGHIKDFKG